VALEQRVCRREVESVSDLGEKSRNKASERFPRLSPLHLRQRRLRLGQPEGHAHGTVQLDSRRQLGARLLPLARCHIQRAEAPVAVRLERAHTKLLSQGEGLLVVGCGLRDLWRLAPCSDVAEDAQGIGLGIPFVVLAGLRQCPLSMGVRLLQTASAQLGLPQGQTTERLIDDHGCGHGLLQRLREQRHGVGDASAQRVRRPQGHGYPGKIERQVDLATDAHGAFEQGECPGQVTLVEPQETAPPTADHHAGWVIHRLGNLKPFVAEGPALGERAQLGMAPGEVGTGDHGGQDDPAEALVALCPL
jgi:hypothetical protein